MPTAEARIPTDRASRYLVQLCRHADHMRRMRHQPPTGHGVQMPPEVGHVDYSETDGVVRFAEGQWTLQATADALTLRVEAADDDSLRRLQDGIAARLETIGRRDQVTVAWHRPETTTAPPGDKAAGADPAAETGAGKRRWRGRLGTIGLVTGGALIVALHLGLGGAALAAAPWIGWTSNIVLVIILVKVVFMAGHVILGRFAVRRGKTIHNRWKLRQSPPDPTPATGQEAAADRNVTPQEHA